MSRFMIRRLSSLRRNQKGIAAVEFALGLPMLALVTISGLELAWLAVQQQRVSQIAAQAADNASRVTGTIDEADIHELMSAAGLNGENMNLLDNGRVIISSVQLNDRRNGQWIRWQRCAGERRTASRYGREGKGRNDGSLPGVGSRQPLMAASAGSAIIVAEVEYQYQPLITGRIVGDRLLRSESAYVVRDRANLDILNNGQMPESRKLKCN
jgi:Flp pilus assembly pilin Flp